MKSGWAFERLLNLLLFAVKVVIYHSDLGFRGFAMTAEASSLARFSALR